MKTNHTPAIELRLSSNSRDVTSARRLFLEYAQSLDFDLWFQNFDEELQRLPGEYAPPSGRLFLARINGKLAGCVALHGLSGLICEMKRLYVRPKYRGLGLGRLLAEKVIIEAEVMSYRKMRLDTIATMVTAIALYERMGFARIPAYRPNPIQGAVYMELQLNK